MAEIPDRGDVTLGQCALNRVETGPVVAAAAEIDLRPANGFARNADPKVHCRGIIAFQMAIVTGDCHVVFALAVFPDEGRTFESDHKERGEYRGFRRRDFTRRIVHLAPPVSTRGEA